MPSRLPSSALQCTRSRTAVQLSQLRHLDRDINAAAQDLGVDGSCPKISTLAEEYNKRNGYDESHPNNIRIKGTLRNPSLNITRTRMVEFFEPLLQATVKKVAEVILGQHKKDLPEGSREARWASAALRLLTHPPPVPIELPPGQGILSGLLKHSYPDAELKPSPKIINSIIIVGGFGCSEILQARFKKEFESDLALLGGSVSATHGAFPQSAIVEGAACFGRYGYPPGTITPDIVTVRVARFS